LPVFACQNCSKVLATQAACPHPDQGSSQIPYHIAKKAVTTEAQGKILRPGRISKTLRLKQGAYSPSAFGAAAVTGANGLKAGKVVAAQEEF
jgi:hypothetical protein